MGQQRLERRPVGGEAAETVSMASTFTEIKMTINTKLKIHLHLLRNQLASQTIYDVNTVLPQIREKQKYKSFKRKIIKICVDLYFYVFIECILQIL